MFDIKKFYTLSTSSIDEKLKPLNKKIECLEVKLAAMSEPPRCQLGQKIKFKYYKEVKTGIAIDIRFISLTKPYYWEVTVLCGKDKFMIADSSIVIK